MEQPKRNRGRKRNGRQDQVRWKADEAKVQDLGQRGLAVGNDIRWSNASCVAGGSKDKKINPMEGCASQKAAKSRVGDASLVTCPLGGRERSSPTKCRHKVKSRLQSTKTLVLVSAQRAG